MKRLKFFSHLNLIILFSISFVLASFANDTKLAKNKSIKEILLLAINQSDTMAIAKEQKTQEQLNAQILDSGYKPIINLSVEGRANSGSYQSNNMGLNYSQKIWQPLTNDINDKKATTTQTLANLNYQKKESDLIYDFATAYFEALKVTNAIEFAQNTYDGALDALKLAQILQTNGKISLLELMRSQTTLDSAKANLINANQNKDLAFSSLNALVKDHLNIISNEEIDFLVNLADSFIDVKNNWINELGEQNFSLKIAYLKQKLATLALEKSKNPNAPELNLIASANYSNYSSTAPTNLKDGNSHFVGLSLTIPLYQAGNFTITKDKNKSSLVEAQIRYDSLKNDLEIKLKQLINEKIYLEQVFTAYEQAKKSSQSELEKTKESYQLGASDVSELNQAITNYALARLNYQNTRINKILNFIKIYHLLSKLTKENVSNLLN